MLESRWGLWDVCNVCIPCCLLSIQLPRSLHGSPSLPLFLSVPLSHCHTLCPGSILLHGHMMIVVKSETKIILWGLSAAESTPGLVSLHHLKEPALLSVNLGLGSGRPSKSDYQRQVSVRLSVCLSLSVSLSLSLSLSLPLCLSRSFSLPLVAALSASLPRHFSLAPPLLPPLSTVMRFLHVVSSVPCAGCWMQHWMCLMLTVRCWCDRNLWSQQVRSGFEGLDCAR